MLPPKTHLPPGPWTAKGNRVTDGYGNTIATVFWRYNPAFVAEWLAELPKLIELSEQTKRIEKLEADLADAHKEIEELEDELDSLRSDD